MMRFADTFARVVILAVYVNFIRFVTDAMNRIMMDNLNDYQSTDTLFMIYIYDIIMILNVEPAIIRD